MEADRTYSIKKRILILRKARFQWLGRESIICRSNGGYKMDNLTNAL